MTHIYYIKKYGSTSFREPCRILAHGQNGNIAVEFADWYRMVTIRFGVRKITTVKDGE